MRSPIQPISHAGKGAALALATAMLVAVSGPGPAQAAPAGFPQASSPAVNANASERLTDVSAKAKKRHVKRQYRRNDAAAAAIFGLAAGAIGSAIAESRRRDYYRQDYYYGGDPYYGAPYYGGPAYYGGYGYGGGCYVRRLVGTPWGPRWRLVNRCY